MIPQLLELGDVLQHAGPVTETHALLPPEVLGPVPVLTGPRGLQIRVQPRQLIHQVRTAERLLRQRIQLGALILGQGVAQPLRRRRSLGQSVDQLVDALRILREELAVLGHEVAELLVGVLPAGMGVEQIVEVREHLLHPGAVLLGGALERLLHALEALVEHLAAE